VVQKVTRGTVIIKVGDKTGWRTLPLGSDGAWYFGDGGTVIGDGVEEFDDPRLASPLSTQSMAPSPCSRMAVAVKDALWPPTQMKHCGSAILVALARSMISGTLAR